MKRQGGFTLIEMIVVIVILGILAVAAAPRFMNFEGEARLATLQGVQAAVLSASNMAHAAARLEGIQDAAGQRLNDGTTMDFLYPNIHEDTGINSLVDVQGGMVGRADDSRWVWSFNPDDTQCVVIYAPPTTANGTATVTIENTCG